MMSRASHWWLDTKLAWRMLIRYPGLTLAAGFGIAIGVALCAGSHGVIEGSFLPAALPLPEGHRLVSIELWDAGASAPEPRVAGEFGQWRRELKTIENLAAFHPLMMRLEQPGARPETVRVAAMTAAGFAAAGVRPLMGRVLEEGDERVGAPAVLVIGESVWRHRFAADPGIVGRTVLLNAVAHAIAGVMPESFRFPVQHRYWVPLRPGTPRAAAREGPALSLFGRLAPGETSESAAAELMVAFRRTARGEHFEPRVLPYASPFMGIHGRSDVAGLRAMQGVTGLVLLVICLNAAILVYSRTALRQGEISLRAALGASRARLVAQLFLEALVLAGAGAAGGLALAALGLRYAASATTALAAELPFWVSFQLPRSAIVYAAGLAILAAAVVGVLPALRATGRDVQPRLGQASARGGSPRLGRIWTLLVVAQTGFAMALLPAVLSLAWVTLREAWRGPGFAAERYLSAEISAETAPAARRELERRVKEEPAVAAAAFFASWPGDEPVARLEADGGGSQMVHVNRVDASFLSAFDVPVLAGRAFTEADVAAPGDSGVVLVNEAFARQMPGGVAPGRRVRYAATGASPPGRWYEIAGVVADFPPGLTGERGTPRLALYHPVPHGARLAIRVRGTDPAAFAGRLAELAAAANPSFGLERVRPLDSVLRQDRWIRYLEASVMAGLIVSVLLLSAAGTYALLSLTVTQRRREIGIRMALGADRGRLLAGIFSRALGQLGAGAGLGAVAAVGLHHAMGLLRGDLVYALPAVAGLLLAAGGLALLGPARRGLGLAPMDVLRE